MDAWGIIKTARIFSTYAITKQILVLAVHGLFFATSHGKSPCDGIGGTAKHLTACKSLQHPIQDQILTTKDMFEFCNLETSKELDVTRAKLKDQYTLAKNFQEQQACINLFCYLNKA